LLKLKDFCKNLKSLSKMNDTILKSETRNQLKDLVDRIEKLKLDIKSINPLYFEQGFGFTDEQYKSIARYKKLKKEYRKKINQIIKTL